MPLLVLHTNARNEIVRVERVEEATAAGRFAALNAGNAKIAGLGKTGLVDPDLFMFTPVKEGILRSPALTEDQRAAALLDFDRFKPGDKFVFVDAPEVVHNGADAPPRPRPLLIVFVDP